MQYKVRLRNAVVFGFAALALLAGIVLAAATSPRFSAFVASVGEGAYEKAFGEDPAKVDSKQEEGREQYETLLEQEGYWQNRLTYPTGRFDPAWVRKAVQQDAQVERGVPAGVKISAEARQDSPFTLDPNSFTPLGPKPERMTGCAGCYDYGTTEGRVNAIAVDPTTTTPGSIVAYITGNGGGVWKTTTCCSAATTRDPGADSAAVFPTAGNPLNHDTNHHT